MIVATTGTNEQPFDRLVTSVAPLGAVEELLVQYGSSRVPHGQGTWVDFLPFADLEEAMRRARVVISHAGVGSIMLARRCGKVPIVMPRRLAAGEAVDDHQHRLAIRLAKLGIVTLAETEQQLAELVLAGPSPSAGAAGGGLEPGTLVAELSAFFSLRAALAEPVARVEVPTEVIF
jgi:UDP-N-acetylglucosamine transferase subunit ALG13